MKKRVLFVASNPFNPDPRAEKQMESLDNNGYQVSGIGWDRTSDKNYLFKLNEKIKIKEIGILSEFGSGMKNLFPLLKFNLVLFIQLMKDRKEFDIIQSVNFDTGFTCLIFAKLFNKKIVYDIYDYYVDAFPVPEKLRKTVKCLENHIINSSDLTILPIDSRKEQIKEARPKELLVIYNTPAYNVKNTENSFEKYYDKSRINITFVGALVPDRFLLELVDTVLGREDIFLHIAGFGTEEIVDYIKVNSGEKIRFYGKVKYEDGLALSEISDVMIAVYNPLIPNHKFSAPNKFYESLYLGKPIIVANGTGIDELVRKYEVGYTVNYDKASLNSLLDSLNKDDLNIKSKYRKSLYAEVFSWEKMESHLLNEYRKLSE